MAVATFTKSGTKATTAAKLDQTVFGVDIQNHELLKAAYVAYLANGRQNLAVVKTRGLVSGGGRKPWRQKGTGRARFGSSRNPIWRGGGIVFGPTGLENYTHKLPSVQKRQAIRQALTLAAQNNKIIIMEDIVLKEGKAQVFNALLTKVGVTGKALVVVDHKTEELTRAARNLSNINVIQAQYINVFDVMNAQQIVMTAAALQAVQAWLGAGSKA